MHDKIVTSADLAAHLTDPEWIILYCQHDLLNHAFGREAYALEHIAGAHFVAMERDMAGTKTGRNGRHPLPAPAALEAVFGRLGVSAGRQVVDDGSQNNYAGRVWWTLRWLGHHAVAVLDGGLGKWKAEGHALTTEVPVPRAAVFTARPDDSRKVDVAAIVANLGKPGMTVVDARAAERYSGKAEPIDPVAGHIPGALLRFGKDNIRPDGTYKSAAELKAEFAQLLGNTPP